MLSRGLLSDVVKLRAKISKFALNFTTPGEKGSLAFLIAALIGAIGLIEIIIGAFDALLHGRRRSFDTFAALTALALRLCWPCWRAATQRGEVTRNQIQLCQDEQDDDQGCQEDQCRSSDLHRQTEEVEVRDQDIPLHGLQQTRLQVADKLGTDQIDCHAKNIAGLEGAGRTCRCLAAFSWSCGARLALFLFL